METKDWSDISTGHKYHRLPAKQQGPGRGREIVPTVFRGLVTLPTPCYWTSGLLNYRTINFSCFKPPSLQYFVMAAPSKGLSFFKKFWIFHCMNFCPQTNWFSCQFSLLKGQHKYDHIHLWFVIVLSLSSTLRICPGQSYCTMLLILTVYISQESKALILTECNFHLIRMTSIFSRNLKEDLFRNSCIFIHNDKTDST